MVCLYLNRDVHYRSLLKETSYWVTTIHGDAPTEFGVVSFVPRVMSY